MYCSSQKLIELKSACKAVGLNSTGKKSELVDRLNHYVEIRSEVEAAEAQLAAAAEAQLATSTADQHEAAIEESLSEEDTCVQVTINKTTEEDVYTS